MRWELASGVAAATLTAGASTPARTLVGPLAPLSFMVGEWRAAGTASGPGAGGDSAIQPELAGRVLVRNDHVTLKAGGGFEIYQLVYADGSQLRSEFIDTEGHVIHYKVAAGPGARAVFDTGPSAAQGPAFRLTYSAQSPDRLHIRFEIAPPGGAYKVYSEGDLVRK